MTGQLPPSKFGKGYTYGGTGRPQPGSPGVPPPTPAAPQQSPAAPTNGAYGAYQSPPAAHNPYASPPATNPYDLTSPYQPTPYQPTPYQPMPTPPADPYGAARATPAAWNANPQQPGPGMGSSAGTFLSSGEGAPKTAAILSIVGGLWAALTVIQRWDQIKALFKFYKYASHLPTGSGYYYLTLAATIAEIIAIPLLLVAGFLLWQRNQNSIKAVMTGNCVVIVANLILAFAINKVANALTGAVTDVMNTVDRVATKWHINSSHLDSLAGALNNRISSISSQFIVVHLVLPALLAVVAIILARSAATKLWVRQAPGYGP